MIHVLCMHYDVYTISLNYYTAAVHVHHMCSFVCFTGVEKQQYFLRNGDARKACEKQEFLFFLFCGAERRAVCAVPAADIFPRRVTLQTLGLVAHHTCRRRDSALDLGTDGTDPRGVTVAGKPHGQAFRHDLTWFMVKRLHCNLHCWSGRSSSGYSRPMS